MGLSENLRAWKKNLTTRTPAEYVLTLRSDINCFADEAERIESENERLRDLVRELWISCPIGEDDCRECEHNMPNDGLGCELYVRMRELGIEVKNEH